MNRIKRIGGVPFAMIPNEVIDDNITPEALMLYCRLIRYLNRIKLGCFDSNYIYLGNEELAKEMRISIRTIQRKLAELKSKGIIAIEISRYGFTVNDFKCQRQIAILKKVYED